MPLDDSASAFQRYLHRTVEGQDLSETDAAHAFHMLTSGAVTPAQIAAFLVALRLKGETVTEITAAAQALRRKMLAIDAPEGAIDTCGTGGDAKGTWNISTAVAFVVAGCGVPVAKHGNRSISSRSGSSDVLTALDVVITNHIPGVEACLREAGICFMMAPFHHPAMRHVAPIRKELGLRTIFNLLGPLANPAGVKRQLVGVYAKEWTEPLAHTLQALGSERAWVVWGHDGMDELTVTGPSSVAALENGEVRCFRITPEDAGLPVHPADALRGGTPETNARALTGVLSGETGTYRDAVLLNAAAALVIAGKAENLRKGVELAAEAMDSGRAREKLAALVNASHRFSESITPKKIRG